MSPLPHNKRTLKKLGDLSIEQFLLEYWQKKPLLIKQAIPDFQNPLDADEIAGLSLEEESNSRLVIENSSNDWNMKHGPLDESDFDNLPKNKWSLLVQHVDALDPEVNELLSLFRFIPNWRLDDIMVSYASDQGGVGPHFDYYDVFLLQGAGKRRWRIGQHCDAQTELMEGQAMQILKQFECTEDWTVEAGDLIYIPGQIAHWGEAIDESITYSIGFRAPSHSELLLDLTQHLNLDLQEDQRYSDSEQMSKYDIGEIPQETITRIQNTLENLVNKPEAIADWLGEYATTLKPGLEPENLPLEFATQENWLDNQALQLSTFCRASYHQSGEYCHCYINGEKYPASLKLAKALCNYKSLQRTDYDSEDQHCVSALITAQVITLCET